MKITALMVKELREITGAGMLDCKKALQEKDGNLEEAIDYLREKGISKAAKKSGRIAAEGMIFDGITSDAKIAVVLEFNSETDFVAKNTEFVTLGNDLVKLALDKKITNIEDLKKAELNGEKVDILLTNLIAKIGENMNLRRLKSITTDGFVTTYNHMGGKLGVVVEMSGEPTENNIQKAKGIAMHIAAMDPAYLSPEEVPTEDLKKEMNIARIQLIDEGKPEKIIANILNGKERKFYEESCLVKQVYVRAENKETVEQFAGDIKIKGFVRFKVGEGIEKKNEDFAAEVAAQING